MRISMAGVVAGVLVASSGAQAQSPVVVELFTSQGCSSCPPADAVLEALTERPDVIALGLHVDYWDYIGWTDIFADPAFTARQKGYARAHGTNVVYTPQMVINGEVEMAGHKPMAISASIANEALEEGGVRLNLDRDGDAVTIRVRPESRIEGDFRIELVGYDPEETVDIRSGENAGKTLTYHNIVRSWDTLATWDGRAPLAVRATLPAGSSGVVLVQQIPYGPIMAAARLP